MAVNLLVDNNHPSEHRRRKIFAETLPVRLTPAQMAAIDEWRGRLPGKTNRSEAIRLLLDAALRTER